MRGRFEFTFHVIAQADALGGDVDSSLALLGSQGWEIRGIARLSNGSLSVALQRPYADEGARFLTPRRYRRVGRNGLPVELTTEQLEREAS